MSQTLSIKLEKLDDLNYSAEVDNGTVTLHITTTSPQLTILRELRDNGFIGKRGRRVGSRNKKGTDELPVVEEQAA